MTGDPARLRSALAVVGAFLALVALSALAPALSRVLDLALPFFGLVALGYVCGKIFDIGEDGLGWLNVLIVNVALPCLFFQLISRTPLETLANPGFLAGVAAATLCAYAAAFAVGMTVSRGDLARAAIQGAAGAYANVGYMGPGLTLAAIGPQAAAPAALVFAIDTIILFSIVPMLMSFAKADGQGAGAAMASALKRIALHPFNIATAVAIAAAAFHLRPPAAIDRMVVILSGAAAPCALFALGVTVARRPLGRPTPETPALLAIKLFLHPALAFGFLWLAGVRGPWLSAAVLMASLPPALNVFVLAAQYRVYVEEASTLVLYGTLASVVTVTTLLWALG